MDVVPTICDQLGRFAPTASILRSASVKRDSIPAWIHVTARCSVCMQVSLWLALWDWGIVLQTAFSGRGCYATKLFSSMIKFLSLSLLC